MGWCNEDGTHEGYLVGLVDDKDNRARGSFLGHAPGRLRELGGAEETTCQLSYVKAACSCGWRSPLIRVPFGADVSFSPSTVFAPEDFEDDCARLWSAHVRSSGYAPEGGYRLQDLAHLAGAKR